MLEFAVLALTLEDAVLPVEPHPRSIVVATDTFDRWKGEIRTHIRWAAEEPFLEKAECKLSNKALSVSFAIAPWARELPAPVIRLDMAEIEAAKGFDEVELTGLTVGSRMFQLKRSDWTIDGWFAGYRYRGSTIVAGGARWSWAARETADEPWLPLGALLPSMMNAEKVTIYARADGFAERPPAAEPFGKITYHMSGLREATNWCMETLASRAIEKLPDYILEQSPVLDAPALKKLLSDVVVRPPIAEGLLVSHPDYEIFQSGGVYVRGAGRLATEGTFQILHSEVCADASGDSVCRKVAPNPDGTYTFYSQDGSSQVVTISPR